ncbi:glutathione S-transferase family protein [Aspergillus melleus]|uniref:glutathione S-transferase family protein n=1 Tax=Aspergillus melleus TaxID=138277 RepID=UPI001E8E306A|nr:glutathione S- transferase, nitrogen catabolite repression regulator [Aspergillus melleus]KAH8433777.1 glutathione S- transferase, nitrogen catabolite repression regulator [Aspergillus melleus]
MKPIKVYGGSFGPNPFKVCVILGELDIPYAPEPIDFSELKTPQYEGINPNGRLPAIFDPNTGITLWESGAIIEYLVETYDQSHRLSFRVGSAEAHYARQWLYFQTTGQGPYYGQAVWFTRYHPAKVDTAVQRYVGEMRRVSGVLDKWLEHRKWLVGEKMSYADLAFIPWQNAAKSMLGDYGFDETKFPNVCAWLARMNERPVVKELIAIQERMIRERQMK